MTDKICKNCNERKPMTEFYKMGNGVATRCKTCYNKRYVNNEKMGIEQFEGKVSDMEGAKNVLTSLGYDLEGDIHQQFLERITTKYGKL